MRTRYDYYTNYSLVSGDTSCYRRLSPHLDNQKTKVMISKAYLVFLGER